MRNINYKDWAEYYAEICLRNKLQKPKTLELASGSGQMALYLSRYIPDIILSDLSKDMLKLAAKSFTTVCCDMGRLPFRTKFDFIICAFDSINYLLSRSAVNRLFKEVYSLLSEEGIFSFDVSLERNSVKNIKLLNKKSELDGIKYVQKSFYDIEQKVHCNEFEIITPDGQKHFETHRQKIYPIEFYFEMLDKNSFYIRNCWNAFSFSDAKKNSDRVQFVVLKDKSRC